MKLNKKIISLLTSLGILISNLNMYNTFAIISNSNEILEQNVENTVVSENNFTTIEETEHGYFDDMKIEGKTLVNLFNTNKINIVDDRLRGFLLRDSKTFTVFNKSPNTVCVVIYEGSSYSRAINVVGNSSLAIELNENEAVKNISFMFVHGWTTNNIESVKNSLVILEGNVVGKDIRFFEGLKSIGQDVNKISISSVDSMGNLFDGKWDVDDVNRAVSKNYIPINKNKQYKIITDYKGSFNQINFQEYDSNLNYIKDSGYGYGKSESDILIPSSNCSYIKIFADLESKSNEFILANWKVQSIDIIDNIKYNSYNEDKKSILYYNEETQSWEKPILREWDSIEKHADGKYYYHKRSEEIVLDGKEDWRLRTDREFENSLVFQLNGVVPQYEVDNNKIITDKFNWTTDIIYDDIEGIYFTKHETALLRIFKSRLNTEDELGFKAWLQDNPVKVVYQLNEEKVYECSNLDLKTYQDETNFIVESGIITPKVTLKYSIPKINELAKEAVETVEANLTLENLDIARGLVNQMEECRLKEQLQERLNNLSILDEMQLERKNSTSNLDVYVKSENLLHMALSTNQISFNDYSGVNELEQLNAIEISINSSLPYQLNSYLLSDIKNSDGTKEIDIDRLNIKDNTNDIDIDYKEFTNLDTKLVLKDSCDAGNDIKHKIDLKLKGGDAYPADIYKTVIKFEAEQK